MASSTTSGFVEAAGDAALENRIQCALVTGTDRQEPIPAGFSHPTDGNGFPEGSAHLDGIGGMLEVGLISAIG